MVTTLDRAAVLPGLPPDARVYVGPFTGDQDDAYGPAVRDPLKRWAAGTGVRLITVEGLYSRSGPPDLAELRRVSKTYIPCGQPS